jgi:hypothetical protein
MICASENNHRWYLLSTIIQSLYSCNQLTICWICLVNYLAINRDDDLFTCSYTNWESRFVKVVYIIIKNTLMIPAPTEVRKVIINIFNYMRSQSFCMYRFGFQCFKELGMSNHPSLPPSP